MSPDHAALTVDALGQVVCHLAVLVLSAAPDHAGVDTLLSLTGLLGGALAVGATTNTWEERN